MLPHNKYGARESLSTESGGSGVHSSLFLTRFPQAGYDYHIVFFVSFFGWILG